MLFSTKYEISKQEERPAGDIIGKWGIFYARVSCDRERYGSIKMWGRKSFWKKVHYSENHFFDDTFSIENTTVKPSNDNLTEKNDGNLMQKHDNTILEKYCNIKSISRGHICVGNPCWEEEIITPRCIRTTDSRYSYQFKQ